MQIGGINFFVMSYSYEVMLFLIFNFTISFTVIYYTVINLM